MTILVIPAIDLLGGKCVRLLQGAYDKETVYFEDPVLLAKLWRIQNACALHVVDLDAARGDSKNNRTVIKNICSALDIPVQLGGGIRTMEDVQAAYDLGVYRVIIGTAAVRNPDLVTEAIELFCCRRLVVGIDAKDGEVLVQGWTEGSGIDAVELSLDMEKRGVNRIIYTDISRDGTMAGPNIDAYKTLGTHLKKVRLTASGGVGSFEDLKKVADLAPFGVDSVIIGRALYENSFPCQKSWCWHDRGNINYDRFSTATLNRQAPDSTC